MNYDRACVVPMDVARGVRCGDSAEKVVVYGESRLMVVLLDETDVECLIE